MHWNDLIGTSIGPYSIVDELGRGGSARVFRAWQEPPQRYVALKIMVNDADDPLGFVRRFEREVELVAQLNHPNIVAVYDSGQHEELIYLVMQCVNGGTLRQRFGQPLSVSEACAAMMQMGYALHHAHLHGIVHRDVKPSNMLVSAETPGHVLLTDFGIAKLRGLRGLTKSGTTIGTPEYMAPEQAEGREVDARADVYSLGCVLFEALAGRPPFVGSTPVSVLYQQVHARPDYVRGLNPEVPRELARIIDIALAKRPNDRFVSAESFAQALQPYTGRSPAVSIPLSAASPPAQAAPVSERSGSPARGPGTSHHLSDGFAQLIGKRVYAAEHGAGLDERAPVGSGPLGDWGASGLDDLFPETPTLPNATDAATAPAGRDSAAQSTERPPTDRNGARPPVLSGPVSGPRPTIPLAPVRPARGASSLPLDTPEPPLRVERPHRDSGRLADQPASATSASTSTTTPAPTPLRTLAAAVPEATGSPAPPPGRPPAPPRERRKRQRGSRRGALGVASVLALVGIGALVGVLVRGNTLAWLVRGASPTATHIAAAATTTPAPSPTVAAPVATATLTQQQLLDQQAVAAFRAVTLGTFADQGCASANNRTSFATAQSIYVNLCMASTAAYGHITILLRQNGATIFVVTRDAQVSPGQWYSFYTYNVSPGPYDILVTYNGGTGADATLTVH